MRRFMNYRCGIKTYIAWKKIFDIESFSFCIIVIITLLYMRNNRQMPLYATISSCVKFFYQAQGLLGMTKKNRIIS